MFLKKEILVPEWKMDWKLEGQDRREHRETSQQAVGTGGPGKRQGWQL